MNEEWIGTDRKDRKILHLVLMIIRNSEKNNSYFITAKWGIDENIDGNEVITDNKLKHLIKLPEERQSSADILWKNLLSNILQNFQE